jgi:histidine triad (HIT) family protein
MYQDKMETIFTKIIKGEIPCYKIAENDKFISFLDISPLAKGHALVVPKIQNDYIFDLDDKSLSELTLFAKKVAIGIEKVIPCKRIGIAVIGLDVPHTHIHLIPINKIDEMNFSGKRLVLTKEEFAKIASDISKEITS